MKTNKNRGVTSAGKLRNYFKINVKVEATEETFRLPEVYNEMKVTELKNYMEFITGIPFHLQRISYLDEGDLLDNTDVRANDIVVGATLIMKIWSQWRELIEAVVFNDIEWVFQLGVTQDTEYKTPNSEYMPARARKQWVSSRADLAMIVAAHRGHTEMVARLIDEAGADVNATTPMGRTALHLASSRGKGDIIDLLLEKGGNIDAEDSEGHTPLTIANKFGHKVCERHLFQFRWQGRANKMVPSKPVPLMAHQYYDSKLKVWMRGRRAQIYFSKFLPPQEYETTCFDSPKRGEHVGVKKREEYRNMLDEKVCGIRVSDVDDGESGDHSVDVENASVDNQAYARFKETARPPTYEEWLSKITDKEKKSTDAKKKEKKIAKQEEEQKKQEELDRASTYEAWLQQKEVDKKRRSPSAGDVLAHIPTPLPEETMHKRGLGALRCYLRTLGKDRSGQPYEEWLDLKEKEILRR
ncbi:LOW QUALITY PROTEIN: uncharacterized protein LOC121388539 [Gigantopelta aegis]|uniref:LOW QUALITY PROTEIN: uncharacterized protein LOC121388539 n=1 Tax=Gigantopelta aegis TaxID=1735272 RepID=UPI001B88C9E5|nr:LOW QUALITY PROTEIN: uncharacterized protein LOC121388539 [Gigantopelta aegis]